MEVLESLGERKKKELSKLKGMLRKGVVEFEYKKLDGSIRKAKGTLNKTLIPDDYKDDDRISSSSSKDVITYYDIKKEDFRAFRKDLFRKIIHQKD